MGNQDGWRNESRFSIEVEGQLSQMELDRLSSSVMADKLIRTIALAFVVLLLATEIDFEVLDIRYLILVTIFYLGSDFEGSDSNFLVG